MQINKYQFQSEIFNKVKAGVSEEAIRKDVLSRRQELRHLAGDNPSLNEFKKVILAGVSTLVKDRALAKETGPLTTAQLELWGLEVDLAGRIVQGLSSLSPTCMDDLTDIKAALDPINVKADRENLQEGDLLLGGKFAEEIERLYGVSSPQEETETDEG